MSLKNPRSVTCVSWAHGKLQDFKSPYRTLETTSRNAGASVEERVKGHISDGVTTQFSLIVRDRRFLHGELGAESGCGNKGVKSDRATALSALSETDSHPHTPRMVSNAGRTNAAKGGGEYELIIEGVSLTVTARRLDTCLPFRRVKYNRRSSSSM
jgi:hypothetical protein